jgi:hypothetical protein
LLSAPLPKLTPKVRMKVVRCDTCSAMHQGAFIDLAPGRSAVADRNDQGED